MSEIVTKEEMIDITESIKAIKRISESQKGKFVEIKDDEMLSDLASLFYEENYNLYKLIEAGNSVYYVPCCNDDFVWSCKENKQEKKGLYIKFEFNIHPCYRIYVDGKEFTFDFLKMKNKKRKKMTWIQNCIIDALSESEELFESFSEKVKNV